MSKAVAHSAPVVRGARVQTSAKESAQFQALKVALNNPSWELTDNSFSSGLVMKFTESGNAAQAKVFMQVLKAA
ncbi:hypothetical protein COU37_03180 [Candidatus Micrarchaeota archaeon CG10_big_fil_rev_8_21_14_0_10_45_29]|nr:MAG: hypothetical protein COU37_03180 [Candidatus Micrarchaeota archaeon CG10_big_fil_rev_8_21_14_0_10_45_29]QBM01581.1 hypothetical protein [uncultured archaeon]